MENNLTTSDPLRNFLRNNPLATIWYKPKVTFRHLITASPEKYVLLFAAVSGIYQTLSRAINSGISERFSLSWLIFVAFLGGATLGVISLYFTGIALHFVGMMLGGEGKPEDVRMVIAWSSIPDGILLLLILPIVLLGGSDWIISNSETRDLITTVLSQIGLFPLVFMFFVLRTIIFISGLTEVNEFPLWKTIITVIVGYIVMFIPFICLLGMIISI